MTSSVFAKLNLKDHKEIVVLNAPDSFKSELGKLAGVTVRTKLSTQPVSFVLAFVMRQADVDTIAKSIARLAEGDAIVWFAYPKGSSKRYTSDINRDSGWKVLGAHGFEGVRMVAIDEDWSAIRFRRVEFIKAMNRHVSGAMTAAGKARTAKRSRA
jgi:hypothetical protein